MSNIDQEHFYYVDAGIGEKSPGCPYTHYQDGRDVKSFIIPPKGYELTGFKLVPWEADKFYDGKIVAQFEKIPFSISLKRNFGKYLLTTISFLGVIAVLAYFFTNRRPKHSTQHFKYPNTEVATVHADTMNQEQAADSFSMINEDSIINQAVKETAVEEDIDEEKVEEQVQPTENTVEPNVKENEAVQVAKAESEPKQQSQPEEALTKEQFHYELWELIHHKERHMRTYKDLYNKYKGLHLKNKEFFYLYLTILENTSGFEEWKANLVKIPDDKLKSINTIDALKQKLEEYK